MAATERSATPDVYHATLMEPEPKTPQVSTEEVRQLLADGSAILQVRQLLADGSAILLDSRKRAEFDAGHIAGARNVAPPPGTAPEE
jgi:3-mercaptopyruvate sulfurtransferase SseA